MVTFKSIRKRMEQYDADRDMLIKKGRDLLKASKRLIYALHRNKHVKQILADVKKEKKALDRIAQRRKGLMYEGSYSEANQEYVEALTYHSFVTKGDIPNNKTLKVNDYDYLLGLCDLTGELARRAVVLSINGKHEEIFRIKDFVEEIHGEFINFDLRNNLLRKKSDQIKYNLAKLEDLLFKIKNG